VVTDPKVQPTATKACRWTRFWGNSIYFWSSMSMKDTSSRYKRQLRIHRIIIISHWQLTRGGPTAWGLRVPLNKTSQ